MSLVPCLPWDFTPTCESFPELSEQSYTVIKPEDQLIVCSNLPSVEDSKRVSQELAAGILTPGCHPQQQARLLTEARNISINDHLGPFIDEHVQSQLPNLSQVNERLANVESLYGDGRVNPCDDQCLCGTLRTKVESLNRHYSNLVTRVAQLVRISPDSAHLDFQIQDSLRPVEEHLRTIDGLLVERTSKIASFKTLCTSIDGHLSEIEMLQECLDSCLSPLEQKFLT